jgi:hypothetical protein
MKFITSLNPKNIVKCRHCVDTWLRYLSEVVAVQTAPEIAILQPHFPDVTFVVTDIVGNVFDAPFCPNIHALVEQGPGIIINSDISMVGSYDDFATRFLLQRPDKVLDCGIRWDYTEGNISTRKLNPYGIDVFKITPDLMELFQGTEFAIGQPGWDYYFVLDAHRAGYYINAHKNPAMFLHEIHTVNWARWKLTLAQAILERRYDMSQADVTRYVQKVTGRVGLTRTTRKRR